MKPLVGIVMGSSSDWETLSPAAEILTELGIALPSGPLARTKYPGQPANLDALCRRFKVDNSERKFHGAGSPDGRALLDAYRGRFS